MCVNSRLLTLFSIYRDTDAAVKAKIEKNIPRLIIKIARLEFFAIEK
jgi:hypothetical protein